MEDTVRIGLSDLYAFPLKNDEKGKKVLKSSNKIKYVKVNEDTLYEIYTK